MNKKRVPTKKKDKTEKLWAAQTTFFLLGFTVWMDNSPFPFSSEEERHSLWKQCRGYLQGQMYLPRKDGDFRSPPWNDLRPVEFWASGDAPEPLKIWECEPLQETQYEYLLRLGLLTEDDKKFIQTFSKEFWEQENSDREYREYYLKEEKKAEILKSQLTTKVGGPDQQTVNIDGNGGNSKTLNSNLKEEPKNV